MTRRSRDTGTGRPARRDGPARPDGSVRSDGAVRRDGSARPDGSVRSDGAVRRDGPAGSGDVAGSADGHNESAAIRIRLDELLAEQGMTLTELSERVGITIVNLSILKNGRARAVRFSTLARLCEALHCQPGDLLVYESARSADGTPRSARRTVAQQAHDRGLLSERGLPSAMTTERSPRSD